MLGNSSLLQELLEMHQTEGEFSAHEKNGLGLDRRDSW